MSGGSFDYLYSKELDISLSNEIEMLNYAISSLRAEGSNQVADDLKAFTDKMYKVQEELWQEWQSFTAVLKALEWWYSGDTREEEFRKAVQKRGA
jgi:hypothetical protein